MGKNEGENLVYFEALVRGLMRLMEGNLVESAKRKEAKDVPINPTNFLHFLSAKAEIGATRMI